MDFKGDAFMTYGEGVSMVFKGYMEPFKAAAYRISSGELLYDPLVHQGTPGLCYLDRTDFTDDEKDTMFKDLGFWPPASSLFGVLAKNGFLERYVQKAAFHRHDESGFSYYHMEETRDESKGDLRILVLTVSGAKDLVSMEFCKPNQLTKFGQIIDSHEYKQKYWDAYDIGKGCKCTSGILVGRGYWNQHDWHHHVLMTDGEEDFSGLSVYDEGKMVGHGCKEEGCKEYVDHFHQEIACPETGKPYIGGTIEIVVSNPRLSDSDDRILSVKHYCADLHLRVGGDSSDDPIGVFLGRPASLFKESPPTITELQNLLSIIDSEAGDTGLTGVSELDCKKAIMKHFLAKEGRCYLNIVHSCSLVMAFSIIDFYLFVSRMSSDLLSGPLSKTLLTYVPEKAAELTCGNFSGGNFSSVMVTSALIMNNMLESGARYSLEETSSGYHLESTHWGSCGCSTTEIYCEHGWAARYPLVAFGNRDRRVMGVGTDMGVDFNSYFDDPDSEHEDSTVLPGPVNSGFRVSHQRPLKTKNTKEDSSLCDQRRPTPDPFDYHIGSSAAGGESFDGSSEVTVSDNDDGIDPDDSSTNIYRYTKSGMKNRKKYMNPGTVLTVKKTRGGGIVEENVVSYRLPDIPEVVAGYIKSESVAAAEVLSYHKVRPINGLVKPFRNNRLNFLMHLHTAMYNAKASGEGDLLHTIRRMKHHAIVDPSTELLMQVLKVTFDWDEMVVSGNPHDLPYLEAGMGVDEEVMVKCFKLLHSQYLVMWFGEVKNLRVPDFHRAFNQQRTTRVDRDRHFDEVSTTRSRPKSVLSMMTGRAR